MDRIAIQILAFAVLLACVVPGHAAQLTPAEQTAVDELREFVARIALDERNPAKPAITVDLSRATVAYSDLASIKELPHLESLYLDRTDIDDAKLAYLAGLTQLRNLNLEGTHITDAGLENLRGLPIASA